MKGQILRFRKNQRFGRAFRFQRGDLGIVEKVYPNGTLAFWSEKYPRLPFSIRPEDVAEMVEITSQKVTSWPEWADIAKFTSRAATGENDMNHDERQAALRRAWFDTATDKTAWEVYVDSRGMAHDDEGNSWPVHGWSEGTYFGSEASRIVNQAPRSSYAPSRPRLDSATQKKQLAVLDALLARRPDRFIQSLRDQVARGAILSEKQRKILRQNLYRNQMRDDATLFKAAANLDGDTTGDGTRVGLFIPLPNYLAEQYPDLGDEDDSPPHVTLLYVGEVRPGEEQKFLAVLTETLRQEPGPIRAWTNGVDSFVHPHAERTVYYTPIRFSRDVGEIRDRLWVALEEAGFDIQHKFPLAFFPHTTLGYVEGLYHEHGYEGTVPDGAWEFDTIQVWGLPKVYDIPLRDYAVHESQIEDLYGENDPGVWLRQNWDFLPKE